MPLTSLCQDWKVLSHLGTGAGQNPDLQETEKLQTPSAQAAILWEETDEAEHTGVR